MNGTILQKSAILFFSNMCLVSHFGFRVWVRVWVWGLGNDGGADPSSRRQALPRPLTVPFGRLTDLIDLINQFMKMINTVSGNSS